MRKKTYFISKLGCAKNQVDAEIITGILSGEGWTLIDAPKDAEAIIINSCGFIESAKTESLEAVFQARHENPNAKIILAGCLAERYPKELSENLPEADIIFGNGDLEKISEVFKNLFESATNFSRKNKKVWVFPQKGVCCGARPKLFNFKNFVYIKITEGCSNFCSFCAIPIIRGAVRSLPISKITEEIKKFLQSGIYEFNLIGQDLAAFKSEKQTSFSGLAELLKAISALKGNFTVRLLYIHPDHFPLDILPIMADDKRFLPYFDLPFQSGSEKTLKDMNRSGNSKIYLKLLETINLAFKKTIYKRAYFRTTFLTGFPGETETEFNKTLEFLKNAKPLWSGVFTFSPEENTKAFSLPNQVPNKIAEQRKILLQKAQEKITQNLLQDFIGEKLTVLVEEIIHHPTDEIFFILGRAWFQAPEVDGCVLTLIDKLDMPKEISEGTLIKVKISAVNNLDLEAKFLEILF